MYMYHMYDMLHLYVFLISIYAPIYFYKINLV